MKLQLDYLSELGSGPAKKVCGAIYLPGYGNPGYSDLGYDLQGIEDELLTLPWITKRTARHEYFMSEVQRDYSYGNRGLGSETYKSEPFSPHVSHLMKSLNRDLETELNVCFLNKYDDQHQHLGWHADEFPGMREDQPILVVSFGAEREIWLKDKRGFECPTCTPTEEDYERNPFAGTEAGCDDCMGNGAGWVKAPPNGKHPLNQRLSLSPASLFIMPPEYQKTHLHRIPKHDRPCGWRISLTFRSFYGPS